jgi:hypothetical protein
LSGRRGRPHRSSGVGLMCVGGGAEQDKHRQSCHHYGPGGCG